MFLPLLGGGSARGTAQHGKAAAFREQTIGVEDPGAFVGALLVQGFAEALG
ncbi:MAG: hypothetical protein ABI051_03235 [Vicinamibacterales bacterium]